MHDGVLKLQMKKPNIFFLLKRIILNSENWKRRHNYLFANWFGHESIQITHFPVNPETDLQKKFAENYPFAENTSTTKTCNKTCRNQQIP